MTMRLRLRFLASEKAKLIFTSTRKQKAAENINTYTKCSTIIESYKLSLIVASFLLLFINISNVNAATYYSRASGNWNVNTTWSTSQGTAGTPGTAVAVGTFPVAGDNVNIDRGNTVTVTANAACATITFRNTYTGSSILTISGTNTLAVSGLFSMNRPGTGLNYNVNVNTGTLTAGSLTMSSTTAGRNDNINITTGTCTINGTTTTAGAGSRFILSSTGTLNFNGATTWTAVPTITTVAGSYVKYIFAGAQTVVPLAYNNLTLGGTSAKTTTGVTVNQVLSMEGTATVSVVPTYGTSATLQYNRTAAQNSGAEWLSPFAATGGVKIAGSGAITMGAAKVFNASVPLTINDGATLLTNNLTLTLGGNFVKGTGTFTAGSSPIIINSTMVAQSIAGFTTTGLLTISKSAGVATLGGNVNCNGITTNIAGGTLNLGAGLNHISSGAITLTNGTINGGSSTLNVNILGATAWTGVGANFAAGTGTVVFGAAGAQSIATSTSTTFNGLSFAGGGVKTIGVATTVNGTLTLTSGLVTLGANSLTLGASSPAVAGSTFSSTNMVVATGTGELRKVFTGTGSYLFPIGDNTATAEYSPITLNFTSGTFAGAYAGVRVTNAKHPNNTTTGNYLNRYWSVTSTGITTFSCNVSANYLAADIVGTETNQITGKYTAAAWTKFGALGSNTLTANAVNSFGDFTGLNGLPTMNVTPATLSGAALSYPQNTGPSASTSSFTVTGDNLSSNISITPPADFEISTTTGVAFVATNPLNLTAVSGSVNKVVYVRLKAGLALGNYNSEIIDIASTGLTNLSVTCSGSVTTAPVVTAPASVAAFTYMYTKGPSINTTFNVSGSNLVDTVYVTPPTDFEISTTGLTGSYQSTAIKLNQAKAATLASTPIYIRMKGGLGLGNHSGNVVVSTTGATSVNVACSGVVTAAPTIIATPSLLSGFVYTTGAAVSNPQAFTIVGTNLSANITVTAPANFQIATSAGGTYGSSLSLTQTGGSVNTTLYARLSLGLAVTNYGPANITLSSTNAVVKTVALKGSVVINSPKVVVSKSILTGFGYLSTSGGPSSNQSFTVSGTSLSDNNVTVTPPTNYEIKTETGAWTSSTTIPANITLTPTTGVIAPTIIYARLKSSLPAENYGVLGTPLNIAVESAVTNTINVGCIGVVFASPLITATGGGSFCTGDAINLISTDAGIQNRYWQGPNNFYSLIQNPIISSATSLMTGDYIVTGNVVVGGNLVTNGDFENDNTGFGSGYAYTTPGVSTQYPNGNLWPEGVYTVHSNPRFSHINFVDTLVTPTAKDISNPGTKMMIINGNITAGAVVWSQSVPVVQNADYEFTYYLQSVVAESVSQLQLYVNGLAAGPVYKADLAPGSWKQFLYNTNSGSNQSLNLELINQNTAASGNDFALDEIVFRQILPAADTVQVEVSPALPVSVALTPSANPVYSNTLVTFTAAPTNGGLVPTYKWTVNGNPISGETSSTYSYVPLNGDIVTCELTSSLSCATNNPATATVNMTVNKRINYWMGGIDTDWAKPGNWTANFVPLTGDDVEYATAINYPSGGAAQRDLVLDMDRTIGSLINATTKRLVIPASKGLVVNNTVLTDGNPNRIYITSSTTLANGSLIYHNAVNSPVSATVEMYSKAYWDLSNPVSSNKYHWQYFGIPLDSCVADPTFYGSYVREWEETGTAINNHWIQLNNKSVIVPFYGYELCQQSPTIIVFQGNLVNSDFDSGQLAVTPTALYPGQHVFANPYTAAIDIRQLTFGEQTEGTVYMYNTGTYSSWTSGGQTAPGSNPGQYTSASKNLAGYNSVPRQVPSMQAMLVKAMSNSATATFGITYNSVVMNNTDAQRVRSEDSEFSSDKVSTLIDLSCSTSGDRMWIFTEPQCKRTFDNGWDGPKIVGSSLSPQLYAVEPDGNYQVNAVNDMNNTELAFQSGSDVEYTMTFTHTNSLKYYPGIYLYDKVENKVTDITVSGSQYKFVAESTPGAINRFTIVARHNEKDTPDANSEIKIFSANGTIFVHNFSAHKGNALIYDISGHFIKNIPFGSNGVTAVGSDLASGAYVAKCITEVEDITKRIIVR